MVRRTYVILAAALAGFACLAPAELLAGLSPDPAKRYPDFKSRKSALGPVALVGDVVVVEDVVHGENKVYREECRKLGGGLLGLLAGNLESQGFSFSRRTLVSVGSVISDREKYRVLDTWEQHTEDASGFPLSSPPVYQDSALCATDSTRAAWKEVFNDVWGYGSKKGAAGPVSSITGLRDAIGADYALVVVIVGSKVPVGRELLFGSGGGNIPKDGFVAGVDMDKYRGTGIRLAVLDCRSGEVLWLDGEHHNWRVSLNNENLGLLIKKVVGHLE